MKSVRKMVEFLNYVHMATHGYMSTYFIGILMSWAYDCNIRAAVRCHTNANLTRII